LIKSHAVGVASERSQSIADAGKSVAGADVATVAPTAARDAMFEKLSKMFRHAGTDVAAQALFRVIVEHRVETMGKHK
jgi:hypothetical protein